MINDFKKIFSFVVCLVVPVSLLIFSLLTIIKCFKRKFFKNKKLFRHSVHVDFPLYHQHKFNCYDNKLSNLTLFKQSLLSKEYESKSQMKLKNSRSINLPIIYGQNASSGDTEVFNYDPYLNYVNLVRMTYWQNKLNSESK